MAGGHPWTRVEIAVLQQYLEAETDLGTVRQQLAHRTSKSIEEKLYRMREPERVRQNKRRYRLKLLSLPSDEPDRDSSELLVEATAFIRQWGLTETQFGSMAMRSPSLIDTLRQGRVCKAGTEDRIRAFMANGNPRPNCRNNNHIRVQAKHKAARLEAEAEAITFRANDPVEQAKQVIRSRFGACFEAEIVRPKEIGKFMVGARLMTRDEMFEFARRKGWNG